MRVRVSVFVFVSSCSIVGFFRKVVEMSLLARIHGWRGVVTVRSGVSTWSRSFGLGSRRMASTTSGEEDSDDDFKPKVKKADGIIEEIGKVGRIFSKSCSLRFLACLICFLLCLCCRTNLTVEFV